MARRSPARFLAPLALVAVIVALFAIVTGSSDPDEGPEPNQATEAQPTATPEGERKEGERERRPRRTYVVRPGDTPSQIAEETGVPLEQILELNPDLDPQTLSPGQRLRLRQ